MSFTGKQYNNPPTTDSSIGGAQIRVDHFLKKAMIEARREQYFGQLADVTSMPKNMGKKIKKYHYIPMLDDANVNDQGLDAAGAVIATTEYYASFPALTFGVTDADSAAARTAIQDCVGSTLTVIDGANGSHSTGKTLITLSSTTAKYANATKRDAVIALNLGVTFVQGGGALYGSSKDVGSIVGKLPLLSENGGRVNRVGFTRKQVEGTIEKYGFFDEYTQESVDFDSDDELRMHVNREMLNGAYEITEDLIQKDLLNGSTTQMYAGTAGSLAAVTGATDADFVDYGDLLRLHITLNNKRCPLQTTMMTGTRLVDTKTISGGRVMYVGSEMQPIIEAMKDLHQNPAFVPVHQYAAGGNELRGEIGTVGHFRIVVVPEMQKKGGAGVVVGSVSTCYETNERFDVFPMLVVGDGAFSTIGFQTDGKTVKFSIKHAAPGSTESYANDPYGETGFMSIKWYYGMLIQRSERLGLIWSAAKL